ncbi:MAG: ABC transporter permease [Dongiaceae bacterium]
MSDPALDEPLMAELAARKGRSQLQDAMRRFRANPLAVVSLIVLIAIVLACFLGPYFLPFGPDDADFELISSPPDFASGHYFGTDELGRDLLARTLVGGRVSLLIGALATLVSLGIGVLYGAISGFVGKRTDALMMRTVDILYSMPYVFFVIMLTTLFERSIVMLFIAIGAVQWLTIAVIVRGQTLSLKGREFIEAARAGGMRDWSIIRKHIVPNTAGPVIVYASLTVPEVILGESFLSFLGLGVQEPDTSWGVLLEIGAEKMGTEPWLLLVPGAFLVTTLFALNFIADGLRDAFDPNER